MALDQPALELMAHLGVEAVLVTNPAEALAALGNGPLGVDIETAHRLPRPPARLTRGGELSATQPKSDDEAGLDPHHAEIATLQLYAGGQQSFVFRGAAITSEVRRRVLQGNCIVHNAAFELAFFRHHWGAFPVQFECTMQAAGLLLGVNRRSLADTAYACMGVKVPKELQRSDWGAEELSPGQIAYAAADAVLAYRLWPLLSDPKCVIGVEARPALPSHDETCVGTPISSCSTRSFRTPTSSSAPRMCSISCCDLARQDQPVMSVYDCRQIQSYPTTLPADARPGRPHQGDGRQGRHPLGLDRPLLSVWRRGRDRHPRPVIADGDKEGRRAGDELGEELVSLRGETARRRSTWRRHRRGAAFNDLPVVIAIRPTMPAAARRLIIPTSCAI